MTLTDLLVGCLALLPSLLVMALVHELGHALFAWWNGFEVTSFGVGIARPIWVGEWRGARVYLCHRHWTTGMASVVSRCLLPAPRRSAWMVAGGAIANAVVALVGVLLWLWLPGGRAVWLVLVATNGLATVLTLIPATIRTGLSGLQTDGALLLRVLRDGVANSPAPIQLNGLPVLRSLLTAVGDQRGLYPHLLGAAAAWLQLGTAARA